MVKKFTQLDTWLENIQGNIREKLIVIIDSCKSGSFINVLIDEERLITTSTNDHQDASFANEGGASFSYYFWSEIKSNKYLDTAYFMARNYIQKFQTACIEADGFTKTYKEDNIAINDLCLRIDNKCQKAQGAPHCNITGLDAFEPDNTYIQARTITTDYTECHSLYNQNNSPDEDWIIILAPNNPKKLQILNPGQNCDPVIELFDFNKPESSNPIRLDDGLTGENEIHEIQGHYYAKITNYNTQSQENTSYSLKISKTTGTADGAIYGYVINASDPEYKEGCDCQPCGTPLNRVVIILEKDKIIYMPVYKKNDSAGMYYIGGLDAGTYQITATINGYMTFTEEVQIKQYDITQKDTIFKSITCDLNGDSAVDLEDIIIGLKVISGMPCDNVRDDYGTSGADSDNNQKIGLAEVIYLSKKLQKE